MDVNSFSSLTPHYWGKVSAFHGKKVMFGSCTDRKKGREGNWLLVVKVIASGEGGAHIFFPNNPIF